MGITNFTNNLSILEQQGSLGKTAVRKDTASGEYSGADFTLEELIEMGIDPKKRKATFKGKPHRDNSKPQ